MNMRKKCTISLRDRHLIQNQLFVKLPDSIHPKKYAVYTINLFVEIGCEVFVAQKNVPLHNKFVSPAYCDNN